MSQQVMLPKNIKLSDIQFSTPKTLDSGAKSVYINLNRSSIIIQTPELYTPFGLTKYMNDDSKAEKEKWTLQLSLRGYDVPNSSVSYFYTFLKNLNEAIINASHENKALWFGKGKSHLSIDILRELFTSLLNYPKDKETGEINNKYPPMFRINVPVVDGKIACNCYNNKIEEVLTTIEKGSKITGLIQCSGIWIAGGKFGCSWKVIQLKVQKPQNISGYSFIADSDDENDDVQHQEQEDNDNHHIEVEEKQQNFIQSSDDEEDELDRNNEIVNEELDEPAQVSSAEKVKKTAKKTTAKK